MLLTPTDSSASEELLDRTQSQRCDWVYFLSTSIYKKRPYDSNVMV